MTRGLLCWPGYWNVNRSQQLITLKRYTELTRYLVAVTGCHLNVPVMTRFPEVDDDHFG